MIDAAIRRLAASSAYELHKPLALAEYPYQHLPVGGFKAYLDVLMQFPELSGPLSKAARKALLLTTQKHREINIIEVHVDLSHIDDELAVVLMTLGFEPDDFFSLHPECYKRHFTLRFEVTRSAAYRRQVLMKYAKHAYDVAVSSVQSHAAIFGYVEMEAYTSANVYSPKCVESDRFGELNDIDQVLSKLNLRPIPVANGKLTNGAKELDAETTKSADLHLKITRKLKLADSEGFYSARALLLRHGFYEIIGESGNSIFTCQFLHANLAKRVFKNLSQAIDLRSTPMQLTWEPCLHFWRKLVSIRNETYFAPVPEIVSQKVAPRA